MESKKISRSGIRIINQKEIPPFLKKAFIEYAKWLRLHYEFPQRVTVYIKASPVIKLDQEWEEVTGIFFAPFDKQVELYIKVATGSFYEIRKKEGVF